MNFSLWALCAVFILIAARKVGRVRISIWQAMTGGALAVLLAGQISGADAARAIDVDVMLFLFGMFIVGQALVASGYLYYLAYRLFCRIRSSTMLVLAVLFGSGLASALLMNDTLAIVGTPLVLRLAREHDLDERLMLLALAFSVTLGSVMSPIGNPQNLLIATRGPVPSPFLTFLQALGPPTLLNLLLSFGLLRLMYRHAFHATELAHAPIDVFDRGLARLARLSLLIVVGLVCAKILLVLLGWPAEFKLSWIASAGAAPILLFSRQRFKLLRDLDWSTLLFFAAMFVLMASVWRSGLFQLWLARFPIDWHALPTALALSVSLSQLISNVPLVALYLPLLEQHGTTLPVLMALAAGSTVAGNLLILGAASNVIIIQHAEKHHSTLGFFEFARAGIPLTLISLGVYWVWLEWFYAP